MLSSLEPSVCTEQGQASRLFGILTSIGAPKPLFPALDRRGGVFISDWGTIFDGVAIPVVAGVAVSNPGQ